MKNNELTEVKPETPSLEGLPQEVIEYVHGLVAENAALKDRTVKVPAKVYVKAMKSNVVRWAQVIDALSDAGVAFTRDDGELIAGTRETSATDAAIAEIKAQGVALAIGHLSKKFTNLGVPITSLEWLEVELRAGRKG